MSRVNWNLFSIKNLDPIVYVMNRNLSSGRTLIMIDEELARIFHVKNLLIHCPHTLPTFRHFTRRQTVFNSHHQQFKKVN